MITIKKTLSGFFLLAACTLAGQNKNNPDLEIILEQKGEVYFSCKPNSIQQAAQLSKIVSVDHGLQYKAPGDEVKAYANRKEFNNFLQLGIAYTLLPSPGDQLKAEMLTLEEYNNMRTRGVSVTYNKYPTYPAYEQIMTQYANTYPNLCKLVTIKTLASGRKLMLLKISDNINSYEDEPQFLYTSSMHGDEIAGYPLMLDLIDYLLTNYNTNPKVKNIVDNVELWICPSANPNGTYKSGNSTVNGAVRYNANNIDLNRNYPDPKGGQHPDGEAYQEETTAFMGFADTMNFVMGANFHGGAEVVNYPWDTWSKAHPDKNWWIRISKLYADTARLNSPGKNYLDDLYSGNVPGVTQGFPWYEVEGGRQDYMNYFKNCRELTIELSANKLLAESSLDAHWGYNTKSLMNFMNECLQGIRGIVTDACTGKPVKAKVTVVGHDADNSHVFSAPRVGNYHRPIIAGTYNLEFSATGYQTKTISGITVVNGQIKVVNVQLQSTTQTAKPVITTVNGVLVSSAVSGNQWYLNGNPISGATGTQYTPTQTGTYTVVSTVCGTNVSNPVVINSIGLNTQTVAMGAFRAFPNPTTGILMVECQSEINKPIQVQLFNCLGHVVHEEIRWLNDKTMNYDLSAYANGLYYLKLTDDNKSYVMRVVLNKEQ